jgi:hypothetical protein
MRIYVHREAVAEAEAFEISETAVITDALELDGEALLLEDAETEIDVTASFATAGVADRAHVFRGRRKRVTACVTYNGQTIERTFSTSTRVRRVFEWASGRRGFQLSKHDAAEHTLQLPDGSEPPGDAHLGSLDDGMPGRVQFDLVPKHRFEG